MVSVTDTPTLQPCKASASGTAALQGRFRSVCALWLGMRPVSRHEYKQDEREQPGKTGLGKTAHEQTADAATFRRTQKDGCLSVGRGPPCMGVISGSCRGASEGLWVRAGWAPPRGLRPRTPQSPSLCSQEAPERERVRGPGAPVTMSLQSTACK